MRQAAKSDAAEGPSAWVTQGIKWGPAAPVVPKGAEVTVFEGEPLKDGSLYTLRLKMPDGYKIPPHWHPTDENLTVLSGTLGFQTG